MNELPRNPLFGTMNQLHNVRNRHQGHYRRVLFVCSAGLLRSATAAHLFSEAPYNWNTRTAGSNSEYALNPVNQALLQWAADVYCMEPDHADALKLVFGELPQWSIYEKKIKVFNIPDTYQYRDLRLGALLIDAVEATLKTDTAADVSGLPPLDDDF